MRRFLWPICLLTLTFLLAFAIGCDNDTTESNRIVEVASDLDKRDPVGSDCFFQFDGWLEDYTSIPESQDDYEVFNGTVQPGPNGGAMLVAYPTTWTPGSFFAIHVPGGALPVGAGEVDFELMILKRSVIDVLAAQCPDKLFPVVTRVTADVTNFLEDIEITGTYMPWMLADIADVEAMVPLCVSDGCGEGGASVVDVWEAKRNILYKISVPHFSDWELSPPPTGDDDPIPVEL